MKMPPYVPALIAFAVAGAVAVVSASVAVTQVEKQSAHDVDRALMLDGQDWVEVTADGLQLALIGRAPDEATRFRALSVAGKIVDPSRLIDSMQVVEAQPIEPPRFSIELLRGDEGIQLIGLIPEGTDRRAIVERVGRIAPDTPITDLLETASYPEPRGWRGAIEFGLVALEKLPRAKVSIGPDKIAVLSMAESGEERERVTEQLRRALPDGLRMALDIKAPRPVITPFTLRFLIDADGPRFDACSAATQEGRARILEAAAQAGLKGDEDCPIGLGVPSPDWPVAASGAIAAIGALGGGSVTISDVDISLVAAQGTPQDLFDREVGKLEGALPEAFSLFAVLPEPEGEAEAKPEGPPEFVATLSPEGLVQIRGRVGDDRARMAVRSFAKSLFGIEKVTDATRSDGNLPAGWSPRLLAALEALSQLGNGTTVVKPDLVQISGRTGNRGAKAEISRILSAQLGEAQNFTIAVSYDESLDPVLGLPTPEECVAEINRVLGARKITFAPGSATIDADARETIDTIAEQLRTCTEVRMEIGGHTDSQGRETMNQKLSQSRAEAVRTALAARRVLTANLSAKGYGEEIPIADNGTEDGREANRRIEFTLILPDEDPKAETAEGDATDAEKTDVNKGGAGSTE